GGSASLDCSILNREWMDAYHYRGHWQITPEDGYTLIHEKLLPGYGFRLDIFNVTKTLQVICEVKEDEEMVWMPGMIYGTVSKIATIKVLLSQTKTCPVHDAYGARWHLTL
ncbi:hypothetical protein SK128_004417, partial [Halocaridina rubra]